MQYTRRYDSRPRVSKTSFAMTTLWTKLRPLNRGLMIVQTRARLLTSDQGNYKHEFSNIKTTATKTFRRKKSRLNFPNGRWTSVASIQKASRPNPEQIYRKLPISSSPTKPIRGYLNFRPFEHLQSTIANSETAREDIKKHRKTTMRWRS